MCIRDSYRILEIQFENRNKGILRCGQCIIVALGRSLIEILVPVKQPFRIFQTGMMFVFFRENDLVCGNLPVNTQIGIIPCNGTFALRCIEVVAFILEDHFVCQYAETVGKSAWNEELTVVFSREFHFYVLAESRRSATYINSYIKYGALNDEPACFV